MHNAISKHRLAAFNHQNGRCYYCGHPMWLKHPDELAPRRKISGRVLSPLRCTAEHLLAKQDGGTNSRDNIVAACHHCNKTRHRISTPPDPERYRERVGRRLRAGKWHTGIVRHLVDSSYRMDSKAAEQ
jgi:5-methylcytosine-specific restriction endonuclease McrA